jgi:hypothetical protein
VKGINHNGHDFDLNHIVNISCLSGLLKAQDWLRRKQPCSISWSFQTIMHSFVIELTHVTEVSCNHNRSFLKSHMMSSYDSNQLAKSICPSVD